MYELKQNVTNICCKWSRYCSRFGCLLSGFVAVCGFVLYLCVIHTHLLHDATNVAQSVVFCFALALWYHISTPVPQDKKKENAPIIDYLILTAASCYFSLLFVILCVEADSWTRIIFYLVGLAFCGGPFGLEAFGVRVIREKPDKCFYGLFAIANGIELVWSTIWIMTETESYVEQLLRLTHGPNGYIVVGFVLWCRPFVTIILWRQFEKWLTFMFHSGTHDSSRYQRGIGNNDSDDRKDADADGGHQEQIPLSELLIGNDDERNDVGGDRERRNHSVVFPWWTYLVYLFIFATSFASTTNLGKKKKLDVFVSCVWLAFHSVIVIWICFVWAKQHWVLNNVRCAFKSLSAVITFILAGCFGFITICAILSPTQSEPENLEAARVDPIAYEQLLISFLANLAQLLFFVIAKIDYKEIDDRWRIDILLHVCFAHNVGLVIRDFLFEIDEFAHIMQQVGFLSTYDQITFGLFWAALEYHFVMLHVITHELSEYHRSRVEQSGSLPERRFTIQER